MKRILRDLYMSIQQKNNRAVFEEGYIETGYIKSSRLIIGE
jgi:hypothetical protein